MLDLKKIVLFYFLVYSCLLFSQEKNTKQTHKIDSITQLIEKTNNRDTINYYLKLKKEIAIKANDKKLLADVLYTLGKDSNYGENEAVLNLQEAIELYKTLKDTATVSKVYIVLARTYQSQSKYDEAFSCTNKSLNLAQKINDKELIINAYSFRANIYGNFSQTDNAIKDLNKAQKIAMQYKDGEKLIPIIQSKSFLYYSKGYYQKSIAAVKEMLSFFKEKNNLRSQVVWRNNLGMIYASCNCMSIKEQKENMHNSIALANTINFNYGKAYASVHLARALMKENNMDSAYYYLNIANKKLPKKINPSFTGYLNQTKGDYWANINNKTNAIKYYEKAYQVWDKLNKLKDKQYVSLNLANFYKDLNNNEKAFKYMNTYTVTKDSLVNKRKIEKEKELELTYEFDRKQYRDSIQKAEDVRVLALQHENKLQQEKHTQHILLFLFGIALILGGFAYYEYQKKKKHTVVLNEKNKIIEKALHEKQLLLKEVHHRVKNNFQIVSSLLELQTKEIEDEKALTLANEGKNRVKSMALIHQKLYQNETGLIDFDEYIKLLVNELTILYSFDKKINTEVQANNIHFDVDTAIPLGLIVNELITNAYKYAFDTEKENKLKVSIDKLNEREYKLVVSDNGKGLDSSIDVTKMKSLGLRLVKRLTKQLHGSLKLLNDEGARFEIIFKDTETRALVD